MPLLWLSLALLSGILFSHAIPIPIPGWMAIFGLVALLILPPVNRVLSTRFSDRISQLPHPIQLAPLTFFLLLILCFTAGSIRFLMVQPKINNEFIAFYNDVGTESSVKGVVVAPPDVRDTYVNLRVQVEQISIEASDSAGAVNTQVSGLLLARLPASSTFGYGDQVVLQGKLVTPAEDADFSYRDYLANHGVYSYMAYPKVTLLGQGQGNPVYSALYKLRQLALDRLYTLYPDPEAGLMAGILLGVQSGIPQGLQEAFRQTGTSHIIVISGFNITIIAAFLVLVFSKALGARWGAILSIIGIILYAMLVGGNPAVVRAAILGIFALIGRLLGRQQAGINSLVFVAAIMAIATPSILWDVSFQLSFAATLGIMLYAEPITKWFTNLAGRFTSPENATRMAAPVEGFVLLTLAAQLTTLPLMIYYFKRVSLTALIANPLILPVQPPLMVLGGLSVLVGMFFHPLGQLLAWAAWPFTGYTIRVVEWLAAIPRGSIALGQVAIPTILAFYILLFSFTFFHGKIMPTIKRLTPAIPLMLLGVAVVLVWRAGFFAPDGKLHVTILNVGTGDAVLIQTPGGRSILMNGGASTVTLSDALGRRFTPFNRSIDWLVVGDIDNEDITGISGNLERFTPSNVWWSGNPSGTRAIADLQSQIIALDIPIAIMQPDQKLDLGSDATLQVISTNPRGAVLLLKWENFRLLLPLGADFSDIDSLQHNLAMRSVSAVLLAESGFAPLNPPGLISALNPQLAVISVAAGDESGLPSPETLQSLQGYNLLRTDQNGWIEITTDGKQMWVEVERK